MNLVSKNMKKLATALFRDESGQSTTEYVLLLLFVVVAVKSVGQGLRTKLNAVLEAAFGKTDQAIQSANTD